jgi:hypothetical protein
MLGALMSIKSTIAMVASTPVFADFYNSVSPHLIYKIRVSCLQNKSNDKNPTLYQFFWLDFCQMYCFVAFFFCEMVFAPL